MSINVKKYTKDQMAKMVEETEEKFKSKRDEYHELAEQLKSQKKEIVDLKSDLVKKNQTISSLRAENAALTEQVSQMNGEAINKENVIANLKADAEDCLMQLKNANETLDAVSMDLQRVSSEKDDLRTKLDYTKAALGRANAEVSRVTVGCRQVEEERDYMHQQWSNAEQRANYAEAHPWRNLWARFKRKAARHE